MGQIVLCGDNVALLQTFPDNSFDSVVTDGPYGLKFMGKKWDYAVPSVNFWKEVLRVLKPGGYVLSFGGTRTYHRMVVNIEDAGFEIRDCIQWLYGSGFPKSLDVSKAIDKQAGSERNIISEGKAVKRMIPGAEQDKTGSWIKDNGKVYIPNVTSGATEEAKQWDGWGTALKPANEPICVARKPVSENTIADNVLRHGTGAININGCRIGFTSESDKESAVFGRGTDIMGGNFVGGSHGTGETNIPPNDNGRWPANVILDEVAAEVLDLQTGILTTGAMKKPYVYQNNSHSMGAPSGISKIREGDEGGASRFFYVAKASKSEKNKGLESFEQDNDHPTVKPVKLMQYLPGKVSYTAGREGAGPARWQRHHRHCL